MRLRAVETLRAPRLTLVSAPAVAAPTERVDADADVARGREAGGPLDYAQYACSCGYVFDAAVSTTVGCPHCGSPQDW
jgi:hypothetical protein